jgi:hypothetical protein
MTEADIAALPMAKRICRTADRFDPTGVPVRMVWAFKRAFH